MAISTKCNNPWVFFQRESVESEKAYIKLIRENDRPSIYVIEYATHPRKFKYTVEFDCQIGFRATKYLSKAGAKKAHTIINNYAHKTTSVIKDCHTYFYARYDNLENVIAVANQLSELDGDDFQEEFPS